ncbi:glycosyltransferase family 9 protein [Agrobacterium rhizogenes]|uniref:glycosyltransferase family 9 protein n=1 Tax=Rhizobium rhizogenes TaxID=359 RepID=UPI0015738FDF|nr:glycosyltransferase family 9 protein [Rhizobium rhizogenes]NTG88259.1 glycosyltransferase family 9 protein [Rhizobium rhizogenes]
MRSLAIVKPDHLGDLVLASSAIRWLSSLSRDSELYVHPANMWLARYLFPDISVKSISFPHLSKGGGGDSQSLGDTLLSIQGRDLAVFLRQDAIINREHIGHLVERCVFTDVLPDIHEASNHRRSLRPYFGDHLPDDFWPGRQREFPNALRIVGLCIGSGFPTNKWSIVRWTALARRLIAQGCTIRVIGGPQEKQEIAILADMLRLSPRHVIAGGPDVQDFLAQVAETDLVIASDGGAGHLCSLAAPVLSIAASVPFRRFAPFGAATRVLSLVLPCSPCLNAHETHLNLCFSHECSYGITEDDVLEAIAMPARRPGTQATIGPRAKLFYGVSHIKETNDY